MRYHVNPKTGNASLCKAGKGKCPFGGSADHYPTQAEAQAAFEEANSQVPQVHTKVAPKARDMAWVKSLSVYNAKSFSDRSTEELRLNADSYWQGPQKHRDHLLKFATYLNHGCLYCGTRREVYLNEHLYSSNRGGITVAGNIGPSCLSCNRSKGDQSASQYFRRKLEDPEFRHPVFGRSQQRFEELLDDYLQPFKDDYPEEYDLALRVDGGDDKALEQVQRNAFTQYMKWQREVYPPANGDYYTFDEELDFKIRLARGEFTTREPSMFEKLKDTDDELEKSIYERALARLENSSSDEANALKQAGDIAASAMTAYGFVREREGEPREKIQNDVYEELARVWTASERKSNMVFVFKKLGFDTSVAGVRKYRPDAR